MRALILSWCDQRLKMAAVSKRLAGGQSSAMAWSSGSRVTFFILDLSCDDGTHAGRVTEEVGQKRSNRENSLYNRKG